MLRRRRAAGTDGDLVSLGLILHIGARMFRHELNTSSSTPLLLIPGKYSESEKRPLEALGYREHNSG